VGWHTFRRSLASLLATKGEKIKVVQELLRHANSSTTQDLYQQADVDAKRAAQEHTSELFLVKKAS
jgi:integrase